MICPNCKSKISDFDEKCPVCGLIFNDYESEKKIEENNKSSTSITIAKRIIVGLLIIITIFMLFNEFFYLAIISIALSIITWVTLTIEIKKIDLLQEIAKTLSSAKS